MAKLFFVERVGNYGENTGKKKETKEKSSF